MISRFELYIQILYDANRRYAIIVILIEIKEVRIQLSNSIKHNTDYIFKISNENKYAMSNYIQIIEVKYNI